MDFPPELFEQPGLLNRKLLALARTLRFQQAVGQLTNTARIGQIRKDIARVHTIRTERVMDDAIRQAQAAGA